MKLTNRIHPPAFSFLAAVALGALVFPSGALNAAEESAEPLTSIVERAEKEKRPILLEFTGSDWCPPCMMMAKTVFDTPEFKKYADENLIFVKLDFPRSKTQAADVKERNEKLAEKFNIEGFPTVVILNDKGDEITRKVGAMPGGAEKFISWVKSSAK